REHLVVPRTPQVDAAAGVPERLHEPVLDRGVAVLLLERDLPLAAFVRLADLLERVDELRRVLPAQVARAAEHPRVGRGRAHVVSDETVVERMVLSRGEAEDQVVERFTAIPEPHAFLPSMRMRT